MNRRSAILAIVAVLGSAGDIFFRQGKAKAEGGKVNFYSVSVAGLDIKMETDAITVTHKGETITLTGEEIFKALSEGPKLSFSTNNPHSATHSITVKEVPQP